MDHNSVRSQIPLIGLSYQCVFTASVQGQHHPECTELLSESVNTHYNLKLICPTQVEVRLSFTVMFS